MMTNPLLQKFTNDFATAPFSKIKPNHFKPAIVEAIEMAKNEIDTIDQRIFHL